MGEVGGWPGCCLLRRWVGGKCSQVRGACSRANLSPPFWRVVLLPNFVYRSSPKDALVGQLLTPHKAAELQWPQVVGHQNRLAVLGSTESQQMLFAFCEPVFQVGRWVGKTIQDECSSFSRGQKEHNYVCQDPVREETIPWKHPVTLLLGYVLLSLFKSTFASIHLLNRVFEDARMNVNCSPCLKNFSTTHIMLVGMWSGAFLGSGKKPDYSSKG